MAKRNPLQLSMFSAASEISAIIGQRVEMRRDRDVDCPKCKSRLGIIGEGTGPHRASINCSYCGRFIGWMPSKTVSTILEAVKAFGRMPPMVIRDISQEFASANETSPMGEGEVSQSSAPIKQTHGTKMTKISEIYPSKYLKAADLQNREHKVAIAGVAEEKLGDDIKPVVTYKGWSKTHPLNKGVSVFVADALGDDTNAWTGKQVIIYPTTTDFQGKQYHVIRVRLPAARDSKLAVSTAMPTPQDDEEPPFDV